MTMKQWIFAMSVWFAFFSCVPVLHAQEEVRATASEAGEVNSLVVPFIEALRAGDVDALKGMLSEEMYREYRVLLEENKEYPAFLARYYEGVDVFLEEVYKKNDAMYARLRLTFPNGDTGVLSVDMKKDGSRGPLRIGRMSSEPRAGKGFSK
jgi:hypothetical protein